MKQLVYPNPDIFCEPGWCLKYVRQAFGAPAVEPTATAGWANAKYKHRDYNFPNAWVPLWFSMDKEPAGHVVLRAPDGRIYSTSSPANTPVIHPNLDHLIWYYGPRVQPQYQLKLTYLGWSEDISNVRVVEGEDEMNAEQEKKLNAIYDRIFGRDIQRWMNPENGAVSETPVAGWVAMRSADLHDILSLNNLINNNTQRVLEAVSKVPGIDESVIAALKEELTSNISVTLTSQ